MSQSNGASDLEIPKDEDYAIRPQTTDEKATQDEYDDIPEYKIHLTLSEAQQDRLIEDFFLEFDAIVKERQDLKLETKWKEMDRLYDGELNENERLLFNVHVNQCKVKINAIVRAAAKAFLGSGQIADITPRPEMAQTKDGYDVCEAQTEFIDYTFDEEIHCENDFRKIVREAGKKFVGIGKIDWSYRREKRKRMETYNSKFEAVQQGGKINLQNEALQDFIKTYPDVAKRYPGLVKRMLRGESIDIVVEYKDTVNNNAKLNHIKIENFYVRNACNYWEGLRTEHCIGEEQEYSYWELLKKQADGEFVNVENLWDDSTKSDTTAGATHTSDYKTTTYKVIEGTYYWKINPDDEEEVKIKCWFGKDKKIFLGTTLFPFYALDTEYLAFYLTLNEYGFYGACKSVAHDMMDSNIAQDSLYSLLLHGAYARTIMTPIVKEGSLLEELFLEKDFVEGMPLPVDEMTQDVNKEIGFVQWPQMNANELLGAIGFAQRMDASVTGITDAAATGANDPSDPTAPAHKTIVLLQQSGINIEDYIECLLPTFNIFVTFVLLLYYQMSTEDRKYRVRRKSMAVTGGNPFKSISRDQMIAKTNIQARASGFVFEKAQERQDALYCLNAIQANPYTARIPVAQYKGLQTYLKTFGQVWRNFADNDLPSPDELDQQLKQVAFQAVTKFMQGMMAQQQTTGVMPKVNPDQVKGVAENAQMGAYNPALAAEAQKAAA